jgi:hypothetical protein
VYSSIANLLTICLDLCTISHAEETGHNQVSFLKGVFMYRLPDFSRLRVSRILLPALTLGPLLHAAVAQTKSAQTATTPAQPDKSSATANVPAGGWNSPEGKEAATVEPRRIAAAIVAADFPTPHMVVQVGASTGALLETFLETLPTAHGEWVEAVTSEHNVPAAKARLGRFGDRVNFKFGCARRDLGPGCDLPKDTDVILIDWLSIQQPLDQMARIYKVAAEKMPAGGWIVNLDHVSFSDSSWEPLLHSASKGFRPDLEGPPIHYPQFRVPTADEQLEALRAAGFQAQVVWQSFTTALIMGRKR